jgi:hypothetical protein
MGIQEKASVNRGGTGAISAMKRARCLQKVRAEDPESRLRCRIPKVKNLNILKK